MSGASESVAGRRWHERGRLAHRSPNHLFAQPSRRRVPTIPEPPPDRIEEPRVVVANREDLWWLLTEASQLEHMIMCQYLFAEFSLRRGTDEDLSEEQANAVERWRKVLRGIAVEEMLHLALVANVMSSIGAAPTLGPPNFPPP